MTEASRDPEHDPDTTPGSESEPPDEWVPRYAWLLHLARQAAAADPSLSIVTAHMAFEVVAERSFAIAPESHGLRASVREAMLDRTFLSSKTRALWNGLTGDRISQASGWKAYTRSVE